MTRHRAMLLALLLLAFSLRVWRLPETPPGLWYDEAYNAMDAVWMAETGQFPVFFVGNNGREPMWHYLLLLSTSLLGQTTFAVRWVGALAGVLTVPVMYVFARKLLCPFVPDQVQRRRLALAATAWLAVSWWHLLNSRAGFRPVLLPPLLMLSLYFWMAAVRQVAGSRWQVRLLNFGLAGFFLGLSQYTYLPARLAIFILAGLVIVWTVQHWLRLRRPSSPALEAANGPENSRLDLKQLWLGMLVTTAVAVFIFAPLGLFFWRNPETFSSRTGDVAFSPDNLSELVGHLLQAISLFLGAGHDLYRHHLPGRAMLGWLEIPFFWIGLVWLLRSRRLRYPETQLLLLGLVIMWLPALLASPPVHSLRPIGLLPFYYLIVTLGLNQAIHLLFSIKLSSIAAPRSPLPAPRSSLPASRFLLPALRSPLPALLLIIALNGAINTYDYFQRWATHPEVYQEYNGPLVDLAHQLIDLSETKDVIIPFHLYVHPTTRYLFWDVFPESEGPPPPRARPAELLLIPSAFQLLYVANIPESPAMVLLTRDAAGRGAAYVSRPPRTTEQADINDLLAAALPRLRPFEDRLGREVAQFVPLPEPGAALLQPLFDPTPLRTTSLNWAGLARLEGYDLTPQVVTAGQPLTLNLYWHSLTDRTFDYRLFLQPIDATGQPLNQWEGDAFREDMYRWRPDKILPTQHTLWLDPNLPPGPYLIRLGFFDDRSGQRLPLRIDSPTNEANGNDFPLDQIQIGLFYVSSDQFDPYRPATPLSATFANSIKLIGVTLPQSAIRNPQSAIPSLPVTFHWQTLHPTATPYTVFLQLLDEQGNLVSSWDNQPFGGLYPTTLWSPGEIIADTFHLPLPEDGLSPGAYRLTTGFYDPETGQRLTRADGSDFAELVRFVVEP